METWKSEKVKMGGTLQRFLKIVAIGGVAIGIYSGLLTLYGERAVPTVLAQQDPFLSRRVDQMEQRFFTIESRIDRIEQESRRTVVTPPQIMNTNDTEIQFLRSQVASLRLRLGEVECGLLRVDERTLTPAARQGRNKGVASDSDKCRLDPRAPIELSARP